jgi:hypothetical protein
MKTLALLLSLAVPVSVFAGFSQAQDFRLPTPAEKAMTTAPLVPGASAAILDWVRIDDHVEAFSSEYVRIKVFTEEGKKYANVDALYAAGYPSFSRVTEISARTIQPDGTIVPFHGQVFDKIMYKVRGRQVNAKTFSLASVQPGSILEYRFQRRWDGNVIFDEEWTLQREIPVLHAKFSLRPMDTRGRYVSFFTYVGLPRGKEPKSLAGTYHLELENIPVFTEEPLGPPAGDLKTRVNFFYVDRRLRPDQFWTVQSADWGKAIEQYIGSEASYRKYVQKGADARETLKNVYAKAQSLRNLSYTDASDDASASGVQMLAIGAGYAAEINRAFVGMARAAGFDAYVVRVAPRDEGFFASGMLDAGQLSDEVAAVVVDGQPMHFDPGTPGAPFGIVAWEKSNTPGMRISKAGPVQWVKVPELKPDHAVIERKADLKVNGESVDGTVVVSFHGQEALLRRALSWSARDEAVTKSFESEMKEWLGASATVKLEELTGMKSHEGAVVAKYSVKVPAATAGSRLAVPLSIFAAAQKNPFAATTRTNPVYFHYPFRTEDEITLTLPANATPAALPAPTAFDVGSMKYAGVATREGNTVKYKRSMNIDAMLVEAKYYNALRNFYNAVVTADQRPLLLVTQ